MPKHVMFPKHRVDLYKINLAYSVARLWNKLLVFHLSICLFMLHIHRINSVAVSINLISMIKIEIINMRAGGVGVEEE